MRRACIGSTRDVSAAAAAAFRVVAEDLSSRTAGGWGFVLSVGRENYHSVEDLLRIRRYKFVLANAEFEL